MYKNYKWNCEYIRRTVFENVSLATKATNNNPLLDVKKMLKHTIVFLALLCSVCSVKSLKILVYWDIYQIIWGDFEGLFWSSSFNRLEARNDFGVHDHATNSENVIVDSPDFRFEQLKNFSLQSKIDLVFNQRSLRLKHQKWHNGIFLLLNFHHVRSFFICWKYSFQKLDGSITLTSTKI